MTIISATHQVCTPEEPPLYCFSERDAVMSAQQRLPRPSSLLMLRQNSRTREETWEFYSVVGAP